MISMPNPGPKHINDAHQRMQAHETKSDGPTCECGDIPVLDLEHERVDEVREQVRAFVVMHLSATEPDHISILSYCAAAWLG